MTALFVIANEYLALAEKLDSMDLDAQSITDTIEASGLTDDFAAKAQGLLYVAAEAEKYTPLIDMEIARLTALKASRAKLADGLRNYLLVNMERSGIQKLSCPLFELSIKANPPAVELLDTAQLPDEFWRTPRPAPPAPVPDKEAIKAALKAGKEVPGAKLVQGTRLVIR